MIAFQRDGSQVLEKDILELQNRQRLGEDLLSKGKRKTLYYGKFSRVNVLR